MKKRLLFLALLLLSFSGVFAGATVMTEGAYRWRNDDGDAITATPKANENNGITVNTTADNLRLRIRVEGDGASTDIENLGELEYSTDETSSSYTSITNANSPFSLVNSVNITAGQSTQSILTPTNVGLVFEAGKFITASDKATKGIEGGKATEFEFVLKLNANALPSTTYFIRMSGIKNSLGDGTPIPRVTTATTLPVELIDFSAKSQMNGVYLSWTTASQQNNEKFIVERSVDGKHWITICTVKGEGNSSSKKEYSVLDQNPEAGTNYYQLKQYDFDGAGEIVASKSVNFDFKSHIIELSVFPNPTFSGVTFKADGFKGTQLNICLINTQGVLVHQEIFNTRPSGEVYKLNLLNRPAPGLYVLKVEGEGVSTSKNIIIK